MELKWTLFKDGIPEVPLGKNISLCVTDFNSVSMNCWHGEGYWKEYALEYPNLAWAEIPIPAVPKKKIELHLCREYKLKCYQTIYNKLYVVLEGYYSTEPNPNPIYEVTYCPFCGFKPENS